MGDRFAGKLCVLCPNASEGVGEHVWPAWLIAEFKSEGPFTTSRGGVAYTKRDGVTPVTSSALPGSHVPMCTPCNLMLGRTIEEPVKDVVRRLIPWSADHAWPTVAAEEAAALARWFLKIGILNSHPECEHDRPQMDRDPDVPRFSRVEPEWVDWMRTGKVPPSGFSVFVARRSMTDEQPWEGDKKVIILPKVSVESKSLSYMTRSFGIRGLDVTIVWHPGWAIVHPLVDDGRAAELWPGPSLVDFALLPEVHPDAFRIVDAIGMTQFSEEEWSVGSRPPLTAGMDAHHFFGDVVQKFL